MIGDDILAALPELTAQAESLMVDKIELREPDTLGEFDPDTNTQPKVAGALVYSGRCRVREGGRVSSEQVVGEQQVTVSDYKVAIPRTAVGIKVSQVGTVITSRDPALVGQRMTVSGVGRASLHFHRHLYCDINDG